MRGAHLICFVSCAWGALKRPHSRASATPAWVRSVAEVSAQPEVPLNPSHSELSPSETCVRSARPRSSKMEAFRCDTALARTPQSPAPANFSCSTTPAQLAAQSRVSAAAVVHDGPAAEETHEEAHVSRCVVVQRAYIDGGGGIAAGQPCAARRPRVRDAHAAERWLGRGLGLGLGLG